MDTIRTYQSHQWHSTHHFSLLFVCKCNAKPLFASEPKTNLYISHTRVGSDAIVPFTFPQLNLISPLAHNTRKRKMLISISFCLRFRNPDAERTHRVKRFRFIFGTRIIRRTAVKATKDVCRAFHPTHHSVGHH